MVVCWIPALQAALAGEAKPSWIPKEQCVTSRFFPVYSLIKIPDRHLDPAWLSWALNVNYKTHICLFPVSVSRSFVSRSARCCFPRSSHVCASFPGSAPEGDQHADSPLCLPQQPVNKQRQQQQPHHTNPGVVQLSADCEQVHTQTHTSRVCSHRRGPMKNVQLLCQKSIRWAAGEFFNATCVALVKRSVKKVAFLEGMQIVFCFTSWSLKRGSHTVWSVCE